MSQQKKKAIQVDQAGAVALHAGRRQQLRSDLAQSLERSLAFGEYDDACGVVDLSERHYVESLIVDFLRHLREA